MANPNAHVTLAFGNKGWYTSCAVGIGRSEYVDHHSAQTAMDHAQGFLYKHQVYHFDVWIRVNPQRPKSFAMISLNHEVNECDPLGRYAIDRLPELVAHMHMLEAHV